MNATFKPAPFLVSLRAARRARLRAYGWRTATLVALIAALWLLSLMVGETLYGPATVLRVLSGETVPGASFAVGDLRLPRATAAVAVGLCFGAAGAVFQTLLRNQLASPDIIGISSGAAAGGVTAIVFAPAASQALVSACALGTALAVAAIIFGLSRRGGFSGTRLILIGIGMAAVLNSVVTFGLSKAAAWDVATATRWMTGSLNTMSWERAWPALLAATLAVPVLALLTGGLGVLRLGDALATGLGVRVRAVRALAAVTAVVAIAVATAATGPLAFVALMSGPIAARLFPRGATPVLPGALVGAVIVLTADLTGQYLFGTRYPAGVVTGVLGAPFLLFLLIRGARS